MNTSLATPEALTHRLQWPLGGMAEHNLETSSILLLTTLQTSL